MCEIRPREGVLPRAVVCAIAHLESPTAAEQSKQRQAYKDTFDLPPVVLRLRHACVDHLVEGGVLLDEDLAEGAVLAQEHGLQPNQFQQRQKGRHQGPLRARIAQ